MPMHLLGAAACTVLGVVFYLYRTPHAGFSELVIVAALSGAAGIALTGAVYWFAHKLRVL